MDIVRVGKIWEGLGEGNSIDGELVGDGAPLLVLVVNDGYSPYVIHGAPMVEMDE